MNTLRRVCVTGIDGSGKSSVCRALCQRNQHLRLVTIWDLLSAPEMVRHYRVNSREDMESLLAALHFPARLHFLFHCLSEALYRAEKEAHAETTLLLDAYWYKYAATEIALGADAKTARAMALHFPEPERTVFVRVPPSVAKGRKANTTAYEEGLDRFAGFEEFQAEADRRLRSLLPMQGLTEVDGTLGLDEVIDRTERAFFGSDSS